MKNINRIINRIQDIEKLLSEIKTDLEALKKETEKTQSKKVIKKPEVIPSDDELRSEYEKLYQEVCTKDNINIIEEFIKSKTKLYLKAFCKANSLPIDTTKASKEKIIKEVKSWIAQGKAITKKVI